MWVFCEKLTKKGDIINKLNTRHFNSNNKKTHPYVNTNAKKTTSKTKNNFTSFLTIYVHFILYITFSTKHTYRSHSTSAPNLVRIHKLLKKQHVPTRDKITITSAYHTSNYTNSARFINIQGIRHIPKKKLIYQLSKHPIDISTKKPNTSTQDKSSKHTSILIHIIQKLHPKLRSCSIITTHNILRTIATSITTTRTISIQSFRQLIYWKRERNKFTKNGYQITTRLTRTNKSPEYLLVQSKEKNIDLLDNTFKTK
jgi:hypothetical protein